jgi:AcrR family transcriptional regulator
MAESEPQRPGQDDDEPLPPGLALLWGRRAPRRRGPRAELSAKALGFTTMSLYRHVGSKDELLALMWNASAQGAEELVIEGETWREKLRAWARVQREMLDRHPWITQMPMAAPPLAPNSLTFVELGLATLDDTGLSDRDKLRIIGLISSYTLSEARMAADAARAAAAADGAPVGYERLLRRLVEAERYPRLHRIAWEREIGDNPSGFEEAEEFAFGIDRLLDGVAALIARAGGD